MRRPLLPSLSLLFLFAGSSLTCRAAPIITEFLASNSGAWLDEDGDASDWIEIHNPDAESVDLTGYYLTDEPGNLTKWQFPGVTLAAGQYLVVFASGKNRIADSASLHTNFGLGASGDYLALVMPDGSTRVSEIGPEYPGQREDVSYGLGVTGETLFSTPIEKGAACRWLVPASDIASEWQMPGYDDSQWRAAQTGIGYGYDDLTGTDGHVADAMQGKNATIYVRIPFAVERPGDVLDVRLRMKYEDGFVAFLNGRRVASANDPTPLQWDSQATSSHSDSDAQVFEEFAIDASGSLVPGENILAIQGLNTSRGGSDLLVLPELTIEERDSSGATLGYFVTPTPGKPNEPRVDGFVADTRFEKGRGFYEEPFLLTISSDTPGAAIRYTTDGSLPTATNGFSYDGPVEIAKTTVLRAAAFRSGWQPANVETQTYIFLADVVTQTTSRAAQQGLPSSWKGTSADYDMDRDIVESAKFGPKLKEALTKVMTVSFVTDVEHMFGRNGVYSNPDGRGERWERPMSMEFIDPETGQNHQIDCGVRMQGGAFRSFGLTKKKSFRVLFKGIYGATKLQYPLFGEGAVDEFDTLTFRMEANDGWQWDGAGGQPQYARDEFGRRSQLALGEPSGHGRNIHLYVNGFYWGVYNLVERPDAAFAASYFGIEKDDWDGINTGSAINEGNARPWRDLTSLTRAISRTDTEPERTAAYYKVLGLKPDGSDDPELERYIDPDNFIDYLLVNWYMANTDWPHNNYYCGRERGPNSEGFKFFMWDAEWTMFIGGSVSTDQTRNINGVAEPQRGLSESLEYRVRFGDRAHRALFHDGPLTPEVCAARYDEVVKDHPLILIAESARWGDQHRASSPRTPDDWQREYDRIMATWFPRRTDTFISQLRRTGLYPETDAPELNQRGGEVAAGFQVTMEAPGTTIYYTLDGTDPRLPVLGENTEDQIVLVPEDAGRSIWVPLEAHDGFENAGQSWTAPEFVEPEGWLATAGPVGFESGGGGYADLVSLDLQPLMQGKSASLLVRIPFEMTQAQLDDIDILTLRARYDDGFVAYINGTEVARANAPAILDGTEPATSSRSDSEAVIFEDFGAAAGIASLRSGRNMLAIHALNQGKGGSDLFHSVELTGRSDNTIASGAKVYAGPVTLEKSVVVRARALAEEEWSALEEAVFTVGTIPASAGNLVISEFCYEPVAPSASELAAGFDSSSQFEFIEITNIAGSPVNLADTAFTEGIAFVFDRGIEIAPGESLVVANNREAFLYRYGIAVAGRLAGTYAGKLNNGGETVTFQDASGHPIKSFTYDNNPPWPTPEGGQGFTLELIRPASNPNHDIASSWRVSGAGHGTPGRTDGAAPGGFTGDPGADMDGDGLPALLEYALGTSETDPQDGNPVLVLEAGDDDSLLVHVTVNALATGIDLNLETSTDLRSWNAADDSVKLIAEAPNPVGQTKSLTYQIAGVGSVPARYARLHVRLLAP